MSMYTQERAPTGRVLLDSAVPRLLSARPAVVVERPEDGAPPRWYRCRDLGGLAVLGPRLLPGSLVSFYFDQRIRRLPWTPRCRAELRGRARAAARTGGAFVLGCEADDALTLRMLALRGPQDVDRCLQALGAPEVLYLGPYPDPDDDGLDAVTLRLG